MYKKMTLGFGAVAAFAVACMSSPNISEGLLSPTLQIFDCGSIKFDDIATFSDTGEFDGREWEVIVPCYLIRHPKGTLIWDVGVSRAMIDSPDNGRGGILSTINKTLADGLAESGVVPSNIDFIALSHMHPDHTGNANMFAGTATWLTDDVQFDFAFRDDAASMGFDQSTYNELKSGPIEFIEDSHDVFGDGTVVILSTPGHTPGHQVLFVDLKDYGPVVLSGDLHITRESYEKHLVPRFNFDRSMTLESMDRIDALLDARVARIIIQHSVADYESLPHAPNVLK